MHGDLQGTHRHSQVCVYNQEAQLVQCIGGGRESTVKMESVRECVMFEEGPGCKGKSGVCCFKKGMQSC